MTIEEIELEKAETSIREVFSHGHPDFITKCMEEIALHSNKNHDYAVGGDPCGNFLRVATILKQYPGLKLSDPAIVAMIYALKQLDAYLWIKSNGHKTKSEGISERLRDISVYAKIIDILDNQRKTEVDNRGKNDTERTEIPLPALEQSERYPKAGKGG